MGKETRKTTPFASRWFIKGDRSDVDEFFVGRNCGAASVGECNRVIKYCQVS